VVVNGLFVLQLMGPYAAHLVLLRLEDGQADKVQVLIQKRSKKVAYDPSTYTVPGGSLEREETVWSKNVSLSDDCRWVVRLRGAVREVAEEAGGGSGPDLLPVCLPEIIDPLGATAELCPLKPHKVLGAKLPASVVQLLADSSQTTRIECRVGGYVHYFFFHILSGVVAHEWAPRAQLKFRWEINEEASDLNFGYGWVDLSDWGPVLPAGGKLCAWAKRLFHSEREQVKAAVAKCIEDQRCFNSERQLNEPLEFQLPGKNEEQELSNGVEENLMTDVNGAAHLRKELVVESLQPFENCHSWVAQQLQGLATVSDRSSGSSSSVGSSDGTTGNAQHNIDAPSGGSASGNFCRWIVGIDDVTHPARAEHYASLACAQSMFCFHGTSYNRAMGIINEGFDPNRRDKHLVDVFPYLDGEYVTTDITHALKFSKARECRRNTDITHALKFSKARECTRNTFSVLVVELPAHNFKLRNGVWFQSKFDISCADDGNAVEADTPDPFRSKQQIFVVEDSRMLVPRALLTFKPNVMQTGTTSAMLCYDMSLTKAKTATDILSASLLRQDGGSPSAVLFDLDGVCWPMILGFESHGPPYTPLPGARGVTDSAGKKLCVCKDAADILGALHRAGIPIVLCSRNHVSKWCEAFIANCPLAPKTNPELKFCDVIHKASRICSATMKVKLQSIKANLGLASSNDMLFFAHEKQLCEEASHLGVRSVHVNGNVGINLVDFKTGLDMCQVSREAKAVRPLIRATSTPLLPTDPSLSTARAAQMRRSQLLYQGKGLQNAAAEDLVKPLTADSAVSTSPKSVASSVPTQTVDVIPPRSPSISAALPPRKILDLARLAALSVPRSSAVRPPPMSSTKGSPKLRRSSSSSELNKIAGSLKTGSRCNVKDF